MMQYARLRWTGSERSETAVLEALGYPPLEVERGLCERWMFVPVDRMDIATGAIIEAGGGLAMKTIEGDLIELAKSGRFDVIIHGCNCFHTMGAGIAQSIRREFPEAYHADLRTPKGSRSKLGTIGFVEIVRNGHSLIVVNGYTQFDYRGRGVKVDYRAVQSVMSAVRQSFTGKRIGYPKIGAGLARGDWDRISRIIDEELAGEDHTLVVYQGR